MLLQETKLVRDFLQVKKIIRHINLNVWVVEEQNIIIMEIYALFMGTVNLLEE